MLVVAVALLTGLLTMALVAQVAVDVALVAKAQELLELLTLVAEAVRHITVQHLLAVMVVQVLLLFLTQTLIQIFQQFLVV
jgi:hypothetical protein